MHNPRVTEPDNPSTTLEDFVTEYVRPELSYDYAALEPHISARIMELHHSKHHAAYVAGANNALAQLAEAREVRGVDRVVIRDGDTIAALLTRMGAHDALMVWEERRMRKEVRATANRLANFDDANLRRSAQAAVAAGARVDRALEILGDDVPDHLKYAGELRVAHKQASLDELGRLADPVMTKDAIAGRIRRLLAMADKRAQDLGIPGTEANVTPEMLDE